MAGEANTDSVETKEESITFHGEFYPVVHARKPQPELLFRLEKGFNVEKNSTFKDMVNYSPRAEAPVHRWFKYREGYSIDLIDALIFKDETLVLDPFCGCGSTLLGARKNGIDAVGIDINPISTFVSSVKTRDYTEKDLIEIECSFTNILSSTSDAAIEKPDLSIVGKAFHPEILEYLLKLKYRINQLPDGKVKDFLLLGYLSIIEPVSNTFKEGNGIKYKFTKRTPAGYKKIPIEKWHAKAYPQDKIGFVNNFFTDKVELMLSDLKKIYYPPARAEVITTDSRHLTAYIDEDTVSLCVFSPPYCNCFDYFEIFKLELWLGEFVKTYSDLREMRRKSLRSNTHADLTGDVKEFDFLEEVIDLMDEEKLWNKKVIPLVRGYFTDMEKILDEIHDTLISGGRCFIIVGNSAYGGVVVPTDILLAKIAKALGYKVEKIVVARNLCTSSQQQKKLQHVKPFLRESLLCLRS